MVDNVQLPSRIEINAQVVHTFQTTIVTTMSGRERRNVDWSQARRRYDIGYPTMTRTDFEEIVDFWHSQQGPARAFLFKDHSDYTATDENIGTGDGSEDTFTLTKTYTNGTNTYLRTIEYPGSLTVEVNGTPTTAFTRTKATIVFDSPPANGHAITWSTSEFLVPVRFELPILDMTLLYSERAAVPSIPVIEVRGE